MQTFLQRVATHILSKHPTTLDQVNIVLPTRRGAFFLMQELAKATAQPIMSPNVTAIDDFVESMCTLEIEDSIETFLELYETFKEVDPEIEFDRFMGWAAVLLSDLDKLDQYLVDTDYLFDYLSEIKAIERWQAHLPAGRTLKTAGGIKQYFALFENIKKVYKRFKERLTAKGKAYRGMAYRQLAENIDTLLLAREDLEMLYFAGFNAFTESEKHIIRALVKVGKAEVLWDTDSYYMEENTGIEAGRTLREYQSKRTLGDWNWTTQNLTQDEKQITIYGVSNATLQTKVAGQIYADLIAMDEPDEPVPTAIVLADENLLLPMIYSLDESIKDFNITMGLSLRNSLLYTLIECIFDLQQNVMEIRTKDGKKIKIPKFGHKSISKILNHPFIRHYEYVVLRDQQEGDSIIQKVIYEIAVNNQVYLSSQELLTIGENHPLFKILFTYWPKNNPKQVIHTFYELIDVLREVYKDYKNAIETEYLYLFYTLLKQFEQTLELQGKNLSLKSLRSFLMELIRKTSIPFSGEPISTLQILGMLETRALDFERVILISANEGILPQAKRQNSLIPYDASISVGLPTHQHQEAVMSYHFYRLLQRASDVHILYTNVADGSGGGEKSRFVQQLEHELSLYNPKLHIVNKTVVLGSAPATLEDEKVQKDEAMLEAIRQYLSGKGIYPTHLNEYIRCSMQFYLKHIVRIEEREEVEEELGMNKIGTWLHMSLERLDLEYFLLENDPTVAQIKTVLKEEFERLFKGYVTDLGLNSIYFQIGEQQILSFLKYQMSQQPRRKVVAAEQSIKTSLNLSIHGKPQLVHLGGKLDRIELDHDGTLHVMDYKTGNVELASNKKMEDDASREMLLIKDDDMKVGYVRQLWLYEFLIYLKMRESEGLTLQNKSYQFGSHIVKSGFYSFRNPQNPISNPFELNVGLDTATFMQRSERILTEILEELLNPAIPFVKTEKLNTCAYCDFKVICGR